MAGHEPQLLASWLQHAYRIAALCHLKDAYGNALDVVRDELTHGIRSDQWDPRKTGSHAGWLGRLAACLEQTQESCLAEMAMFREVSRQISLDGGFDLVGPIGGPETPVPQHPAAQ